MPASLIDPAALTLALSTGGDRRIVLDPATGLNQYFSAPRPGTAVAYASSTANDISGPAFAAAGARLAAVAPGLVLDAENYAMALEGLRDRLRAAYRVDPAVDVVFAASGTDLEYVALALARDRAAGGIVNILLGADEVGSGCVHSAHGRYFADTTALGIAVAAAQPVPGFASVDMVDIPVRDAVGAARGSDEIVAALEAAIARAQADGRHPLIHVVHGSKTGLILPSPGDLAALRSRHGEAVSIVVDACQGRITSAAIADYLRLGATVFVTGSKFMGGPPFAGFALVPPAAARPAVPAGLATIFRRAEWPAGWPGADALPATANLGLWLRLEAAIFELERFQALALDRVTRVILAFHAAVRAALVADLGGRRVAPYAPGKRREGDIHPIEMRTLSTIDITRLPGNPDFDTARALHRRLVDAGIRLGQPVKCVRLPDGRWGGTLRIGLSMPQVVAFDALDDGALAERLAADMARVAAALRAALTASV